MIKEFGIKWELRVVFLKEIHANEKNPRQISKPHAQQLEKLIAKFGLIDKLILNRDLTLIGGHQRYKILKKLKIKSVECWVPDRELTEEEVDHLMVGLNLNQGSWDWDILANNFEALDLLEWGFTEEQLLGCFSEEEEKKEKEKKDKKKTCPSCGHEF